MFKDLPVFIPDKHFPEIASSNVQREQNEEYLSVSVDFILIELTIYFLYRRYDFGMFLKGVSSPISVKYTFRPSNLQVFYKGKQYHQTIDENFMSNDDFSFAFFADGLKILVGCRPSEDGQKILCV